MYIVALTGGIGSGKSEAAKQFAQLGVPVVDTDVIAHTLTATGSSLLPEMSKIFGASIINGNGSLNRANLRALVLNDPAERIKLEKLLHPAIYERAIEQLTDNHNQLHPKYQILVVPLLFENNRYHDTINKTLVIDCEERLQIQRAMARSKLTEEEVTAIMAAQTTRAVRLKNADEIIKNNGSLEELIENVKKIHKKIIRTCIVSK
jgi:dephospho-CoA kinase